MSIINIKVTAGTPLPKQATNLAAGYDIIAMSEPKIVGEKLDDKFFLPEEEKSNWWKNISYIEYETGIFLAPNDETVHTLIYPRSSISSKTNLVLANSIGLIDTDYRGQLLCRFRYIWQPFDMAWLSVKDHSDPNNAYITMMCGHLDETKIYKKGDAIGQLVAEGTNRINFNLVDELTKTARGEGGFGSTNEKLRDRMIKESIQKEANKLMPHNPVADQNGTDTTVKPTTKTGGYIVDAYNKAGGVPIKKRYSTEIKERQE